MLSGMSQLRIGRLAPEDLLTTSAEARSYLRSVLLSGIVTDLKECRPMKLVTFETGSGPRLGVVVDGGRWIIDVAGAFRRRFGRAERELASMLDFIDGGARARQFADAIVADPPEEDVLEIAAARLLAP